MVVLTHLQGPKGQMGGDGSPGGPGVPGTNGTKVRGHSGEWSWRQSVTCLLYELGRERGRGTKRKKGYPWT